jgi:Chaperone of endosialidase
MRYFVVPSFRLFFQSILPLLFAMVAVGLQAQKLSVQGLLKKGDGTSLPDGNYTMKFNFYDTNGNFVAAVTTNDVPVSGGVYSALLDASSASPSNALNFSTEYLVGLVVNGGTELTPRITMSAAPYALALNGSSNKFPSFGTVKADAMDVAGAVSAASVTASGAVNGASVTASGAVNAASVSASGAVTANSVVASGGAPAQFTAGKGYSFGAGGDTDGGLFSLGDNNVALYANNTKALEATNSGVSIPGALNVSGVTTCNSFQSGNNFGIYMNTSNGDVFLRANGVANDRILIGSNGINYINGGGTIISTPTTIDVGSGSLFLKNIKPRGTSNENPRNLAIDMPSGRVFEESSSRRYKKNIRPLRDDFSLLLKVQPRIYNRYEDPVDIDTTRYFEIGYIAEEIDSIGIHKLVQYNGEGQVDGVDYTKMILYAVELLKIQHTDIEKLKAEVAALTTEKNTLRTENTQLRADAQKREADMDKQMAEINRRLRSLEVAASNRK